ncbi:MAG: hypothetical protein P1S60_16225, partial [Anaerolineae bacterium]|nr:hypothetical protein [Anaerolineae bacterium]
ENDPEYFGPQYVADVEGNFVTEDMRLLQAPVTVNLEEAAGYVREIGGMVIPAHIDRAHGLMTVLGLWPSDFIADAAEVSHNIHPRQAHDLYHLPDELTLISNSDAHWIAWIGKVCTVYELNGPPSVAMLKKALHNMDDCRAYVP